MSRKREREVGKRGSHARARTFATPSPNPLPGLTASQLWGMGSWREVGGGRGWGAKSPVFAQTGSLREISTLNPK